MSSRNIFNLCLLIGLFVFVVSAAEVSTETKQDDPSAVQSVPDTKQIDPLEFWNQELAAAKKRFDDLQRDMAADRKATDDMIINHVHRLKSLYPSSTVPEKKKKKEMDKNAIDLMLDYLDELETRPRPLDEESSRKEKFYTEALHAMYTPMKLAIYRRVAAHAIDFAIQTYFVVWFIFIMHRAVTKPDTPVSINTLLWTVSVIFLFVT